MKEIEKEIKNKETMEFEEDITTMAAFCFLNENIDKFIIVPEKRAQMFHSALAI